MALGFFWVILKAACVVALYLLWESPQRWLFWTLAVVLALDVVVTAGARESAKMSQYGSDFGPRGSVTMFWVAVTSVLRLAELPLTIWAFYIHF